DHIGTVSRLARESDEVLGAFLRGQFIVMLGLGAIYALGLTAVGLNLGLLIGIVAGLISFVPYLGAATGIVLAVLAALVQAQGFDLKLLLLVGTVFTVGQLIESYILTPRIVGDRIGLHPVAVIFAIMAGGQLFGFVGMLLALPVAAVCNVLLRFAHERYTQSRLYAGGQPQIVLDRQRRARGIVPDDDLGEADSRDDGASAAMPAPSPSPKLPLALRYPPDQSLETFAGNRALVAQLQDFAAGAGDARMLLLVGPPGSGKTHLALAACAEAEAAGRRAAYLPLATARGRLGTALEAMHAFDLVALDGLDAIAGGPDDELALFDFHNRIHDAGRQLLYTACAAPAALGLQLPDLRSRLGQCTRLAPERLDDAGRAEMLRLRARRRGL